MIDCKDTINFKRTFFCIEQTVRLLTYDVFKKKKNKVGRKQKQHFMWSKYFKKNKEVKLLLNFCAGSFGTAPGPILREYWTGNGAI